MFTSLQLFGHVQVFLAIIVGQMVQPIEIEILEEKTFRTTQNKVAKLQKIALSRTRSHMISHNKISLKHLLLTWTTAKKFLQQWNWMHHSTLLVEVWSEKLIYTLKLWLQGRKEQPKTRQRGKINVNFPAKYDRQRDQLTVQMPWEWPQLSMTH